MSDVMRCQDVERLVGTYASGSLGAEQVGAVESHMASCARCRALVRTERRLQGATTLAAGLRAPPGLAERVMRAVYHEALRGPVVPAAPAEWWAARAAARTRTYRRMGLSFLLSALVLTAFLIAPLAGPAAPHFAMADARVGLTEVLNDRGSDAVRSVLRGAGIAVRGALRPEGGKTR